MVKMSLKNVALSLLFQKTLIQVYLFHLYCDFKNQKLGLLVIMGCLGNHMVNQAEGYLSLIKVLRRTRALSSWRNPTLTRGQIQSSLVFQGLFELPEGVHGVSVTQMHLWSVLKTLRSEHHHKPEHTALLIQLHGQSEDLHGLATKELNVLQIFMEERGHFNGKGPVE